MRASARLGPWHAWPAHQLFVARPPVRGNVSAGRGGGARLEQGGDGCQPDAQGRLGGEAEGVEGGRGPAGCEVPGERGERGVGSVEGVEGLGGRAGSKEVTGLRREDVVIFSLLFLYWFFHYLWGSGTGKQRWEEGVVSNMVLFCDTLREDSTRRPRR